MHSYGFANMHPTHAAVLEQCTRNFSDALALVLSAQLSKASIDHVMEVGRPSSFLSMLPQRKLAYGS